MKGCLPMAAEHDHLVWNLRGNSRAEHRSIEQKVSPPIIKILRNMKPYRYQLYPLWFSKLLKWNGNATVEHYTLLFCYNMIEEKLTLSELCLFLGCRWFPLPWFWSGRAFGLLEWCHMPQKMPPRLSQTRKTPTVMIIRKFLFRSGYYYAILSVCLW